MDTRIKLQATIITSFSLQEVFQQKKNITIGETKKRPASETLLSFALQQLQKEKLLFPETPIAIYPSHTPNEVNPVLEQYFQNQNQSYNYIPGLLKRWKETIDKSVARQNQNYNKISFENEYHSLSLSENALQGSSAIILDDFTTTGMSFEAARLLIETLPVQKNILCAIGKFARPKPVYKVHEVTSPYETGKTEKTVYQYQVKEIQADYQAQSAIQKHIQTLARLLFTHFCSVETNK